jgi:hypothetical protein
MSATLASIRQTLDTYVEPGADFRASLNQVLSRLHDIGIYRGLTAEYVLPVVRGTIVLPFEAESILHAIIESSPSPVRSLWHDYRNLGHFQSPAHAAYGVGVVDAGFRPTRLQSFEETGALYIVPSPLAPSTADFALAAAADPYDTRILVWGISTDRTTLIPGNFALDGTAPIIQFDAPIIGVHRVAFERVGGPDETVLYDLRTNPIDPDTTVTTVGPGTGTPQYRIYRVPAYNNPDAPEQAYIHVLTKRRFLPLRGEWDVSNISNLGAIKHGLLGRIAEDSADLERAEYHWTKAQEMLENESSSSDGGASRVINIDPTGLGRAGTIRQIL